MLSRVTMTGAQAGARLDRALVLLVLASRGAVSVYAACTDAINLTAYREPGLAVAALAVALAASAGGGVLVWRRQAASAVAAVADTAGAVVILLLVALAIRPPDRMGSLNWALAYAVSCASWLALGRVRWWRALFAFLLGVVYGVSVLGHSAPAAATVTAVVNAVSPPVYFGIAAASFRVMRRIARDIDSAQDTRRRQHGESARLGERERLFREMHQPVLAVLDAIASGAASETELRGRACAEAAALRRAFTGPLSAAANGLQVELASLIRERAGSGWTVRLVDEEMAVEPQPAVTQALRDAVAELLDAATAMPAPGQIRIRAQCDDAGTGVVVRIAGCGRFGEVAVERARARLAGVTGTVSLAPALQGEHRVLLRTPP